MVFLIKVFFLCQNYIDMKKLLRYYLFLLFFIGIYSLHSQTLTISSGGNSGPSSGTSWSISGNILTVTGAANIKASVIAAALANGNLTVVGTANNFAVTVSEAITATGNNTLTVGSATNTGTITFNAVTSFAGPVNLYGGSINMDQNMTCTSSGSPILLQSTGAIDIAASRTVQSNSGNITLRSNSGGTVLSNASSIILNSSSSLLSQGGNITLGGNFTGAQGTGLYATSGNAPAILISGGTISAAGGNIKLYGKCNGSYDDGIRLTGTINTTVTGTIELYGEAYGGLTGSTYFGGVTFGTANTTVSTENGNLTIEGILTNTNSSSASGLNFYRVAGGNGSLSIQLLSKTGNIQVSGRKAPSAASYGIGQCSQGDVYIGSPKDNSWTATGNIIMSLSSFDLAASTGIIFKTIGALNVEPYDASFNSSLTFPFTNNSSISGVSAFTMGKASNTANITIGAPGISVAGPITLYGGALSLGANITSTAGGEIALYSDAALAGLSSARSMTTTGAFRYLPQGTSFSSTVTFPITNLSLVNITELQLGKSGNTADITIGSSATIAGPISIYGGYVNINGNLTSSATGDIFIKGIAGTNPSIWVQSGKTITKSGGTGTLTMQGHGRVSNNGSITTSGTGVLNVVFWSDFDNSNNDGGVSQFGTVSTNGGHVWLGGSNSNGGSYTWNGLTVGDGPSIGSTGFNGNAMDISGNITTNGGDFLAWAGSAAGSNIAGIANDGSGDIVSVGSGDIVLITDMVSGTAGAAMYFTQSGGTFTLVPHDGSFMSTFNWNPAVQTYVGSTADDYNLQTGDFNWLGIGELNSITSLTIGYYNGMLSNGTPVEFTNSSNITFSTATTSAGAFNLYGGAIAMNTSLTTTSATNGNISINGTSISGTGNLAVAAGRNATLNVSSTSTYDGIISGFGSGITKLGVGLLTLTKDHSFSGSTIISAGDLQVGTGGSVSQASSGSISNTTAVAVASGSKLILTPNENILFAAPISGAGGVEIKGASGLYSGTALTTTASLIASNVSVLEVLTRITGGTFTGSAGSGNCGAYQKSYNAATNTATLQFQQFVSPYTKVVFVTLELINTTDVAIKGTGAAYRSGDYLGQNMATIGGTTALTFPTNYGISQVFMSGKVNFTGALTYTGTTTLSNTTTSATSPTTYSYISKGTQEITDASSSFPSAIVNNGLVILNRTTTLTIAGDMSGTEDILQVGADVTFTGTNSHTGITTIDLNKTLNIGSGGSTGSMMGNIVNYGALTFNRTGSSSYSGVISGSGTVTKSGSGDLTLNNLNTYIGSTTINDGRLILERDVPATSSSGYSGIGALVIQPSSNSFTSAVSYPIAGFTVSSSIGGLTIGKTTNSSNITFANATTIAGPITAYGGTITLNDNLTTTNNGNISLYSDNALGLSSARTITAAGTFTYASQGASFLSPVTYPIPNLTLSCTGLTIGKSGNTSAISVASTTTINGPITLYGGVLGLNSALSTSNTNTGDISLNGSSLSGNANLTLAAGRTATLNLSSTTSYSGVISGSGSHLIKSGIGDLTLTGANTLSGTTTVSAGMLNLNRTEGSTLPDVANIIVSADINASPGTLNFASNQTINNLSIASNALCMVNPSKKLTVNGVLTNNGTFTINSGSTLVQGTSSTISGSGNYDVLQNITGSGGISPNGRFWYLGSPLSNGSSSALLSYTGDLVWKWNESSFAYETVSTGQTLTQGKSYVLRSGQSTGVVHFLGTGLSNGTVTVPNLTRTGTSQQFRGCHLVSNPYPSYLDWDLVDKTNVSTTMYVRTALGTNYNILETYNSSGQIGTSISGPAMTRYIAPMQGFWVKVTADNLTGSLTMSNSIRSHQASGVGLRSTPQDFPAFLRFNMIDGQNKDQVILLMSPDAAMTLDAFDSEKMSASGFAQFYSTVNAKKLVINGMKNVKAKTSVPLTLEMPTSKSYTFQAEEFNIEDGLILLEDKQEGVIQDLTINPTYSFFGNAGTNATRFVVHFQLAGAPVLVGGPMELESLGSDELSTDNIQIVSNNQGTVIIRLDEGFKPEGSIRIFDASGRLVEQTDFKDQETTIQLNEKAGMYFVEVSAGKLMVKKKIVIN